MRPLYLAVLLTATPIVLAAQAGASAAERRAALVGRAAALELPGAWDAPPGDPLEHHTAGFAKTMCSNVFLAGIDPRVAAADLGFFTGPLAARAAVVDTVVDRARQEVRLRLANGTVRVARRFGSQGCIALPVGADSVFFAPSVVRPALPDPARTPWPMGDVVVRAPWPTGIDSAAVARAMDEGFGPPEAMTLALVVTHNGRIIGERYARGIGIHTPLESWSMGKSLTGTLIGRLIQMGVYRLDQPAPIPEWQAAGDPRRDIRIVDLMRMSSGIRIKAPQDPDWDPSLGYPDHLYLYTGGVDSYRWAATRPAQWRPNTVGRYRNSDPVLASYLVRLAAEARGEDYHAFPQRLLFDKLGIRDAIVDTDPYGNFLGQGYEMVAARDWARLGNLYLQDGVWAGERLLPEGYVDHVRTLAPAWVADGRPQYGGGFFWVNGDSARPLPRDAFSMQGAGGQSAWIVPSHGLVVVRIGRYRGAGAGARALDRAFEHLMRAVAPAAPGPSLTPRPAPERDGATPVQQAAVDGIFARFTRPGSPGCIVGVNLAGAPLLRRAYGLADIERGVPLVPGMPSEIGSVSKQVTAAALVLLAQEGKVDLDADVRRVWPAFPDFGATVTVRHLLNHTSGVRDQFGLLELLGRPSGEVVHTVAEIVALLERQRTLNFPVNTRYLYSNTGYTFANALVARLSGMSFADFTTARLLRPAGLAQAQWRDDFRRLVPRRVVSYRARGDAWALDLPFSDLHGSGGLLMTIDEMLQWTEALHADRIGRPGLRDELLRVGVLEDGSEIEYALGLMVGTHRGLREVSHSGSTAGYRAWLGHYPETGYTIAMQCNAGNGDYVTLGRAVAAAFLAERMGPAPTPAAPAPTPSGYVPTPADRTLLQRAAGTYRDAETGAVVELAAFDGGLVMRFPPAREVRFQLVAADSLEGAGRAIRIDRPRSGPPGRFVYHAGRVRNVRFDRMPPPTARP